MFIANNMPRHIHLVVLIVITEMPLIICRVAKKNALDYFWFQLILGIWLQKRIISTPKNLKTE